MRIVSAGPGGEPMLTGGIAGTFRLPGRFRHGILFAPAIAENLSGLVLEHAAKIPAFDPRCFQQRHKAEARTS